MSIQDTLKSGTTVIRRRTGSVAPPLSEILSKIETVPLGKPVDVELAGLPYTAAAAWLAEYTYSGTRAAGMKHKEARIMYNKTMFFLCGKKTRPMGEKVIDYLTKYQSGGPQRKYFGLAMWVWWRTLQFAGWRMAQGDSMWTTKLNGGTFWHPDQVTNNKIRGMYKKKRDEVLAARESMMITPYCAHEVAQVYAQAEADGTLVSNWPEVRKAIANVMLQYPTDLHDIRSCIQFAHERREIRPWTAREQDIIGLLRLQGRGFLSTPDRGEDLQRQIALDGRAEKIQRGRDPGMQHWSDHYKKLPGHTDQHPKTWFKFDHYVHLTKKVFPTKDEMEDSLRKCAEFLTRQVKEHHIRWGFRVR